MREKELRIALVCFGGISLAVYMHGISKEVLKLVRASRALHAIGDRARRRNAAFFDAFDRSDPEYDTEGIYFELLRDIGGTVELRVIVDVVQGGRSPDQLQHLLGDPVHVDGKRDAAKAHERDPKLFFAHGEAAFRPDLILSDSAVPRSAGPGFRPPPFT